MSTITTVTVYGASDDLIEVEGAISEEFGAYSHKDDEFLLAFSDGTVLGLRYGARGIWMIRKVASGTSAIEIDTAVDTGDENTDRATLKGDNLKWVVFGKQIVTADPPSAPRGPA